MFGVQQHLDLVICKDGKDATDKGFVYRKEDGYDAIEIDKVVVVQNGTEQGNSTVDLIMVDANAKKSVVMITGKLIKTIPCQ